MAPRKPFLLRTDPEVLAALNRWAADELRSVNGQVDFILRGALKQAGRFPKRATHQEADEALGSAPSPRASEQ